MVRIIPCLDLKDDRVVKGTKFFDLRDAGDPIEMAVYYVQEGADELVLLDITASHERRKTQKEIVSKVAAKASIPFTVGGGIGTVEEMRGLFQAGADKVSISSAAARDPDLILRGAKAFGNHRIIVAVDAKRREPYSGAGWEVYINGGRTPTGLDLLEWVKRAEELGAGEILLTSMDADGTGEGYDYELLRAVSEEVQIPVIASGGAGKLEHLRDAVLKGKADAVLAASIFHYRIHTIREAKEYMAAAGIQVRI